MKHGLFFEEQASKQTVVTKQKQKRHALYHWKSEFVILVVVKEKCKESIWSLGLHTVPGFRIMQYMSTALAYVICGKE